MSENFLNAYRFTRQTRRELAEWLPEIAYRENISVDDVINSEAIQSILRDEKLNAPQKHKKIRDILYRMRFPEFSKLQDSWKKNAAAANPAPSRIQFTPSPNFEKKKLEIKLTIENADEARELLALLLKIDPQIWDDLLLPKKYFEN
ncbi:MAG: hypothetical protein LBU70_05620 [Chitinispirillales bacterium]|nr:hypothetical protein [Chitinispirillales bacterium]